jgi:serine O-acetyltransferase
MFLETVKKDLFACTRRNGLKAFLSALVFEPGFSFLFVHRFVQLLLEHGFQRVAKIIWRFNSMLYGCYFHISAQIGPGLYLPHPIAIVIGEGVRIENNVVLYQNVTLGKGKNENDYPLLKSGVIVYPNSVVFGSITISEDVVIGASSVVRQSLPKGAIFRGNIVK